MTSPATKILYAMARRAAPNYIAGPGVGDSIRVCMAAEKKGWSSTICPWDGPEDGKSAVESSYREALGAVASSGLQDCYISVKAPSLGYDLDAFRGLFEAAAPHGIRIHLDSLGPETASPTFTLLEKSRRYYEDMGCTIPSRWRRSVEDARRAVDIGLSVRIVKGQWPDSEPGPSPDPASNYLRITETLAGRAKKIGIATHDSGLAKEALTILRGSGTHSELEQLFGLPARVDVARSLGVNIRVYVPYGRAYLPYALSEARKRPVIIFWVLRDFLLSKRDL